MAVAVIDLAGHFPAITAHLDPEAVHALATAVVPVEVAAGEGVIREGDQSDVLYLLREGELAVRISVEGRDVEVGRLHPGALFGEVSLMDPGPASATVVAVGKARLFRLSHGALDALAAERPDAAASLLRVLCLTAARRVREVDARCDELLLRLDPQSLIGSLGSGKAMVDYFRLVFGPR